MKIKLTIGEQLEVVNSFINKDEALANRIETRGQTDHKYAAEVIKIAMQCLILGRSTRLKGKEANRKGAELFKQQLLSQ